MKSKTKKFGSAILFFLILTAIFLIAKPKQKVDINPNTSRLTEKDILSLINQNMVSGGPGKDGIPAIDNPNYIRAEEADKSLEDGDLVFGIDYKGKIIAFPQSILYWHEIVNEEIDNEKISVTYCPLTRSVIGFKGKNLGVSGKLYNSNLVMYDRATDSEIPQILKTAVKGQLKGSTLEQIPVYATTWKQWRSKYPETLVLSRDTGFFRDYDRNPYPGYESLLRVWFPVAAKSDLFPTKKIVTGVELNNDYLAIPKDEFKSVKKAETDLNGEKIIILYDEDLDVIKVYRDKVDEKNLIPSVDLYWFAWYAYHPDTIIYST